MFCDVIVQIVKLNVPPSWILLGPVTTTASLVDAAALLRCRQLLVGTF